MSINKSKMVAVLGGLGFIGSHLCRDLLKKGMRVRVIDRSESSKERVEDIENQIEICSCDISQVDRMIDLLEGVDVLIHLVHSTAPQGSMSDPAKDVIDNVASTARLASQLGRTNLKKMIYVSSGGAVYGVNDSEGILETDNTNPISSYGITKLANEKYLQMYSAMYGIQCLIARPANVYGPQQQLNKAQGIIGTLLDKALRGEEIEIWGSGEVIRDYLYIDDLTSGIMALLNYSGTERVFNVGSGIGYSVNDIIDQLNVQLGGLPPIKKRPGRDFDVPSNILNVDRMSCEMNWDVKVDLKDGIKRVIESLSLNQ